METKQISKEDWIENLSVGRVVIHAGQKFILEWQGGDVPVRVEVQE